MHGDIVARAAEVRSGGVLGAMRGRTPTWFFARRRGCEDPLGRRQRDLVFWAVALPVVAIVLLMRADWDERYLIPLLPLAAAWTGAALVDLPSRRLRLAALGGLALGGGLNLSFVSFDYWHTARPLGCVQVRGWAAAERVDSELSLCLTYPQHWFLDRPTHPVDAPPALRAIEERLAPLRAARGRPLRRCSWTTWTSCSTRYTSGTCAATRC